ncbi:hypothetical protein ACIBF5_19630 [Micromonospora sp. NPDC050417]|uniref:hypothetical protein n=1 Tax=Micromonospora sp. NPDC050417 TaxID=3364280 RepID=UPI00378E7F2B
MTGPGNDEARETAVQPVPPPRATGRASVVLPPGRQPATGAAPTGDAVPAQPLPPPPPLSQVAAVAGGVVIGRPGSQSGAWPAVAPPAQPVPPQTWAPPSPAPAQWAPPPPPNPAGGQTTATPGPGTAVGQYGAQSPGEAIPAPPPSQWTPVHGGLPVQTSPAGATPAPHLTAPPAPAPPQAATFPGAGTVARPTAQALGTAEALGRASAAQLSAHGIAVPDTGRSGPPDTEEDHTPPDHGRRPSLSGWLTRLRIGSHTASRTALTQLRITSAGSGMILGADRQQLPVSVRMFRPEPARVALVGGVWAGQLLTFRALALGARVAVVTTDPYAWHGFGERATGHGDRVAVLNAEQPLALTGSAHQPVLVIYDLGFVGGSAPPPLGPWQTQLTVLRQLSQSGVPAIQDCELVLLQRLSSVEATLAAEALRLPQPSTQFLQVMADDMLALVGDGAERYVWYAQTEVERQFVGGPRR